MEFSSYYLKAKELKPTGNVSEEDLINMAVSLFCGESIYTRVRGDYARDLKNQTTKKRRAKQISCPYVPCWRKLRDELKFKAAAAACAAPPKKGGATKAAAAARAAADASAANVVDGTTAEAGPVAPAAAEAAAGGDDGDDEQDGGPWEARPIGTKVAKRMRAAEFSDDRTIGRVARAVEVLGDAAETRTRMMGFSQPFMRSTAAGALFWKH